MVESRAEETIGPGSRPGPTVEESGSTGGNAPKPSAGMAATSDMSAPEGQRTAVSAEGEAEEVPIEAVDAVVGGWQTSARDEGGSASEGESPTAS